MIPKSIIIQAEGANLGGVLVRLVFHMSRKNDYSYLACLDETGKAEITNGELLSEFKKVANFFIMDYADPNTFFTGIIESSVLTKGDIANLIQKYDHWKKRFPFAEGYIEMLQRAFNLESQTVHALTIKKVT